MDSAEKSNEQSLVNPISIDVNPQDVSENSPLIENDQNRQNQNPQSLIRNTVEEALLRSYNGSATILCISLSFILGKILASILILTTCETDTDTPLKTFIIGILVVDFFSIFLGSSKHFMYTHDVSE